MRWEIFLLILITLGFGYFAYRDSQEIKLCSELEKAEIKQCIESGDTRYNCHLKGISVYFRCRGGLHEDK